MAIITVGNGQQYGSISSAASAARAGDTIEIFPGTYTGASFSASNLTIQGMGPGVIIAGAVIQGKGLFVFSGQNETVSNITFQNATDVDGNGAGIRFQGTNLTVLNSTFLNNQDGILTDANGASTIIVKNSTFNGNGADCGPGAAHAIYAGYSALLDVENSTFTNTQLGHDIKSRARNTIILNNSISDGPTGTSSYLIDIPNGGAATITGNTLEKGPNSSNPAYAITVGEEGATNPAGPVLIANNTFRNDDKAGVVFAHNQTGNPDFTVSNNTISGLATTVLTGAGTTVVAPTAARPRDFNGDGKSDILVAAGDGSSAQVYFMNGLATTSSATIAPPASSGWAAVATGDFNADGKADIVWQNTATQQIDVTEMNGAGVVASGTVDPGAGWKVLGKGDFNGDGKTDLVLQNGSQLEVMLMNGCTQLAGGGVVSATAPAGYRYVASGDFNGDGKADILWQNPSTSQLQIWMMNAGTVTSSVAVSSVPGAAWKAIDTGDFNGDGKTDILWQNTSTGLGAVWMMNGAQYAGGGALSLNAGTAWQIMGSGDYNGDGKSDILFRNTATGAMGAWLMSGATYLSGSGSLGVNPGTSFYAVAG